MVNVEHFQRLNRASVFEEAELSLSSHIVRVGGLTSTNTDAKVLPFSPSNSGKYAAPFYCLYTPRPEGYLAVLTYSVWQT